MKKITALMIIAVLAMAGLAIAQYTPRSTEGAGADNEQSVTNGQIVTLVGGVNVLTSYGQAATYTNFVTLAAPVGGGMVAYVANSHASSNTLTISTGSTFRSTAIELTSGNGAVMFSGDNGTITNWYGLKN